MSFIETRRNELSRGLDISGHISDEEILSPTKDLVLAVKRNLVSAIVDHLMKELTPRLDRAIEEAFSQTSDKE